MARKKKLEERTMEDELAFFEDDVPEMDADTAIAYINKKVNEGKSNKRSVIHRAIDSANSFLLRRPFGLPTLDLGIAGGMPSGGITQIDGPDGTGKDALAAQAAFVCQTLFGDRARIGWCPLESQFDKSHLRNQGVVVPWSDLDIDFENELRIRKGLKKLTKNQITLRQQQIGEFFVFGEGTHEERLEAVLEMVAQNYCQLIVIDSLAAASTQYRMNTPLEKEAKQAATAHMLSEFMKKAYPYFTSPKRGRLNLTTLIVTNQVRAKQNAGKKRQMGPDWKDSSPRSFRHGKLLDLTLSPGEHIKDGATQIGKIARVKVSKAKAGSHEGHKTELRYLFATGFDMASDLFVAANNLGLILHEPKSPTCTLIDEHGEVFAEGAPWGPYGADLKELFYVDQELYWKMYYACLKSVEGVSCLHKL